MAASSGATPSSMANPWPTPLKATESTTWKAFGLAIRPPANGSSEYEPNGCSKMSTAGPMPRPSKTSP